MSLINENRSEYIGVEAGYALLLNAILDVPEWYHEAHFIIKEAIKCTKVTEEVARKYLGIKRKGNLYAWARDQKTLTYQDYLNLDKLYVEVIENE